MNEQSRADGGTRSNSARSTGAALESHYHFVLWLIPTVDRFPRSQKFLLGDRIQSTALDVLERLVEATYTRRGLTLAGVRGGSWNNNPRNLRSANRNRNTTSWTEQRNRCLPDGPLAVPMCELSVLSSTLECLDACRKLNNLCAGSH